MPQPDATPAVSPPAPPADALEGFERLRGIDPGGEGAAERLAEVVAANWQNWVLALLLVIAAVVIAGLLHRLAFAVMMRAARRTRWKIDEILIDRLRKPARFILPLLAVQLTLKSAEAIVGTSLGLVRHTVSILLIAAGTWLLIAMLYAAEAFIRTRHDVTVSDNLEARRVHTQLRVVRRTLVIFAVVIGAAAILMTFPGVSQFGASLLASAGLAGLVIGLAARPGVENIIAGLQIAMTQPIRLDDVVVIDGYWGRIEEITATYVVLRVWDERRLIIPFSRIIAEPFENWTYVNANTLGSVFIYCDYTVDVQKVREELDRIVKGPLSESGTPTNPHPKWDGRVCNVLVTDATERTVQLRALVSAASSGNAWELRCEVREKLIAFLQREYPDSLPRLRAEVEAPAGTGPGVPQGGHP